MATSALFDEVTYIVSCEICFELLEGRKPRTLSCLHVFCEECLQSLLNDAKAKNPQSSGICCPVCKQTTNIPGGSAASLPLFFYVSKIDGIREKLKQRHFVCKMCKTPTRKANITTYCFECSYGYCQSCHDKHNKAYQNHAQIRITPTTIHYLLCAKHGVHFARFCATCGRAVCGQCYMADHLEHKVYDVSYDGKKFQKNIKQFLVSALKSVDDKMESLVKLTDQVSRDVERASDEMSRHRDHLLKLVDDQYEALRVELKQRRDDIESHLIECRRLMDDAKIRINRLLKQVESWLEPVKDIPEGRISNVHELMADVKQQLPSVDVEIKHQSIKFVSGDDNLNFGRIVKEGTISLCTEPRLLYKIERTDVICDMDYLMNGELVVCLSTGLCVYDCQGHLTTHHLSDHCKPAVGGELWSICVDRNVNRVMVTEDRDCDRPGYVHIYRQNGLSWQYDRYKVCESPWRGALSADGSWYVWCWKDSKLYKYGTDGRQIWSVKVCDDRHYLYDLFVDDDGRTFVCLSDKVVVYDKHGKQTSSSSPTNRELKPRAVCVSKNGYVFVCDERSKSVLLYDNNWVFVRRFVELDFKPWKMALFERRLAVSDWNRREVSVYEL